LSYVAAEQFGSIFAGFPRASLRVSSASFFKAELSAGFLITSEVVIAVEPKVMSVFCDVGWANELAVHLDGRSANAILAAASVMAATVNGAGDL